MICRVCLTVLALFAVSVSPEVPTAPVVHVPLPQGDHAGDIDSNDDLVDEDLS